MAQGFSQTTGTIHVEKPLNFSPNGDGDLDYFVFRFDNLEEASVKIVDQKLSLIITSSITSSNPSFFKWDGKNKDGKAVKEGVYFYDLDATGIDGKKYNKKGKIELTR